jgi:hypothetical protein
MTWIEGFPAATFDAEMEDKTHFSVPLYESESDDIIRDSACWKMIH